MKKLDFIFVILFMIVLIIFGIMFITSKEKEYSKEEDRLLANRPNMHFFSRETVAGIEQFYQDQFLYRNTFLELETYLNTKLGIYEKNNVYIGNNDYLFEKTKKIEYSDEFVKYLNQFYKEHNSLNMSLILIPSHITINPNLKENTPIYDEYEDIKDIYRKITFNTIDVVNTLKEGNKEYEMYYHTDSHLTSYGAYNVYLEYASSSLLESYFITDFDILKVTNDFSGNLIRKVHNFNSKKDTIVKFVPRIEPVLEIEYEGNIIDSFYFENALNDEYMYYYFLGEVPLLTITNKEAEGEILILKDESANAIIPFLTNHYYKVHVIDTNLYQSSFSEYLENHKEIREVLFIYGLNDIDNLI